jgi:hypothetical protein
MGLLRYPFRIDLPKAFAPPSALLAFLMLIGLRKQAFETSSH